CGDRRGEAFAGNAQRSSYSIRKCFAPTRITPRPQLPSNPIRYPQVFLLVGLDHQLVHRHRFVIRDAFDALDAQAHHRFAELTDGDRSLALGHKVNTRREAGAAYFEVAAPDELLEEWLAENIAQHLLGAALGFGADVVRTPGQQGALLR